jgi:Uma2 family endonuclease
MSIDMEEDDPFERWWAATPEDKLELIDGQLVVSTLAGSRRIAWDLLDGHGPVLALPMASSELWWEALRQAFDPKPLPRTPEEWVAWADTVEHDPEPPPAGPLRSAEHQHAYQLLWSGLYRFAGLSGEGLSLGRDFVIRLGENALTPDQLFIDRPRLSNLHDRYLDGPPALAIEITQEGNAEQDRVLKRRLYESAGIPEYWLIEAAAQEAVFLCLGSDGRYHPAVADAEGIYHSTAVPGLALSLPHLWSGDGRSESCLPFLTPASREALEDLPPRREREGELGWDSVPFVPRVALQPVPIRFEEFVSWCPRAKFENLGGGLLIDGSEGSRRCMGMLMMTLGLVEIVKLATPREWVAFLYREPYQELVRERTEALMAHARYEPDTWRDEEYVYGTIDRHSDGMSAVGDDLAECRQNLAEVVGNRVLLRIARRQKPHR